MATGVDRGVLLETDGEDWDPIATADAIVERIRVEQDAGTMFDVLLFGNEAADSGDYQVGIRVAHALGMPCVTGVKELEVNDGEAVAKREGGRGREVFRVPLPAVFTVREGINLPRYPSVPGRLKAKQKPLEQVRPERRTGGPEKVRLVLPEEHRTEVEVLGNGPDAAPKVVELLRRIGVLSP
jgi:electron transfer flavoprotein beta subunit